MVDSGLSLIGYNQTDQRVEAVEPGGTNFMEWTPWRRMRLGQYYLSSLSTRQGQGLGIINAQLYATAFPITQKLRIDRIALEITVPAAAGNDARLGIYYDDGDGYPGVLLSDCGLVDIDAIALVEVIIDITLYPGLYWFACTPQAVCTVYSCSSYNSSPIGGPTLSASDYTLGYRVGHAWGALPNPFTGGGARWQNLPGVASRLAEVF